MKIALCQTEILWEEKEKNLCRARKWLEGAVEQGAELILFPEMSFTGFSMNTELTAEREQETVQAMQDMASEFGISIGFGWVKAGTGRVKDGADQTKSGAGLVKDGEDRTREGDDQTKDGNAREMAENHYTVLGSTGEILSDYVKIHPFRYSGEHRYFSGGDTLHTFRLGGLCIGTLICYDLRFPEAFQILAETCDVIVVPANWPQSRREHWKCLLQARSIECQTYILGVNCCGKQKELHYSGDSCMFAPDGRLLAGFLEGEGLILADILPDVKEYRKGFPTREDRKWNLYDSWYQKKRS